MSTVGSFLFGMGMVIVAVVPGLPLWARVLAIGGFAATLGFCLLAAVRGYEIARGELLVRRLGWSTAIPLTGLRSAEVMPGSARSALRVCGNGGLFAFSGWFWNRRLGRFRMCATDLARTVVLRFKDCTWVITPDRPEDFARELTDYAGLREN